MQNMIKSLVEKLTYDDESTEGLHPTQYTMKQRVIAVYNWADFYKAYIQPAFDMTYIISLLKYVIENKELSFAQVQGLDTMIIRYQIDVKEWLKRRVTND